MSGGPTLQHERGSGVRAPTTRRFALALATLLAWAGLVPPAAAHLLAPSLLELREQAQILVEQAVQFLSSYGEEADLLRALAWFIVERDR